MSSWLFDPVNRAPWLVSSLLLALSSPALAEEPARATPPAAPQDAPSVATPRDAPASRELSQAQARKAQAESAGQTKLLARFDALISSWQGVVDALQKTAELEARADQLEQRILEIDAQARRAEHLVEQTEARKARAWARLQSLGLEPTDAAPPPTSPAPLTQPAEGKPRS